MHTGSLILYAPAVWQTAVCAANSGRSELAQNQTFLLPIPGRISVGNHTRAKPNIGALPSIPVGIHFATICNHAANKYETALCVNTKRHQSILIVALPSIQGSFDERQQSAPRKVQGGTTSAY